jgi:hypothetical protein
MMISVRTARAAIILCGLTAAIAPIDTGWACTVRMIGNPANGEAKGGAKYLVDGEPATAAQVKQCEQCNQNGYSGSACAAYKPESKKQEKNEEVKAFEAKKKAAEQKNKTLNSNTMSNTQNAVPLKKK